MHFTQLVPSVFYKDLKDSFELFIECLEFTIEHKDFKAAQPYYVAVKDTIRIMVFQDAPLALEHYPELRLVTKNIQEVYEKVQIRHAHLLHPNLKEITLRPWGAKEFEVVDKQVGFRIQEW